MKWSQLKKRVEDLFADSVKKRVEFHCARYRDGCCQMGRIWITFDKEEVASLCSRAAENVLAKEQERLCRDGREVKERHMQDAGYREAYYEGRKHTHDKGVFSRPEANAAMFDYLNLSIADILGSKDPIIRAIGMLDHRTGRRRLLAMNVSGENPLVRTLFDIRCELDGLKPSLKSQEPRK